jgi:hypothetical protein
VTGPLAMDLIVFGAGFALVVLFAAAALFEEHLCEMPRRLLGGSVSLALWAIARATHARSGQHAKGAAA